MRVSGLQGLLAPKSVEEFLRDDFQRRPFVVQGGDPRRYSGLLSLDQLEAAIEVHDAHAGMCRLLGGNDPAARRTVEGKGELRDVLVAYGRGASIQLSGLDRRCPAIGELRRQLGSDFAAHGVTLAAHGDSVVFVTPASSQALKPHVDPDDLFVLQLEGRKRWHVYGWDPFWRQGRQADPASFELEVELAPGDLLYVPQQWIHAASAGEEFSFALTIGFRPTSWATVLEALVTEHAFGLDPLFHALPAWALADNRLTPRGQDRLTAVVKELLETAGFRDALDRLLLKPAMTSIATGGIAAVNHMRAIGSQTRCALTAPARVERLLDGVELVTAERRVKGPPAIEPALHWIAQQPAVFAVGDMGGALSDNAKIVLARRLILEGVLETRTDVATDARIDG